MKGTEDKVMKKFAICVYFFLVSVSLFGAEESLDSLMAAYSALLSPEKVYLHTDRDVYNVGDTIWFRAYLENASAKAEYKECNYIYVEILSGKFEKNFGNGGYECVSRVRDRVKIKRDSMGFFCGYFPLDKDYNSGISCLRAYSYWMLNFPAEYMFYKNIEIVNPMKDSFVKDLEKAGISDPLNYEEIGVENPFKKKMFTKKTKNENQVDVQFFPESGRYLPDRTSVLGVKAINEDGLGVKMNGDVYADGKKIASYETNHMGMGKVRMVVPKGTKDLCSKSYSQIEGYISESKLPLPSDKAVVINVESGENFTRINVCDSNMFLPDSTWLVIYNRSGIYYKWPYSSLEKGKEINHENIPSGINIASVVDGSGVVYAERPFFVYPKHEYRVSVNYAKEKGQQASVKYLITDEEGIPVNGVFSTSITDNHLAPFCGLSNSIESYFLLGSELKGYVENPRYYFDNSFPKGVRMRDMDNLLMIQGWKYYDFEKIINKRTAIPRFGKEYTQSISGYVLGVIGKAKKSTLCFISPSLNYTQIADLDSTAYFALNGLDFPDGTKFIVGAQGRGRLLKKWYTPVLNPEYFASDTEFPIYMQYNGYSEDYGKLVSQNYYTHDGVLSYTLLPSRIVAKKNVSPYPEDDFKYGQYRDENALLPYKDLDFITYAYTTCPGVMLVGDNLVSKTMAIGSKMTMGSRYVPINIYLNGFPVSQQEMEGLMVSDIEALAYVTGSDALKYERSLNLRNTLKARPALLVKTKWPVHAAPNVSMDKPLGWQKPAKFYEPKYKHVEGSLNMSPLRLTLHWEPCLQVRNGEASLKFNTPINHNPYFISIEGMLEDGGFVQFQTMVQ